MRWRSNVEGKVKCNAKHDDGNIAEDKTKGNTKGDSGGHAKDNTTRHIMAISSHMYLMSQRHNIGKTCNGIA